MIQIFHTQVCDNGVGETLFTNDDKFEVESNKQLDVVRKKMEQGYVQTLLDSNGKRYKEINVYFHTRQK